MEEFVVVCLNFLILICIVESSLGSKTKKRMFHKKLHKLGMSKKKWLLTFFFTNILQIWFVFYRAIFFFDHGRTWTKDCDYVSFVVFLEDIFLFAQKKLGERLRFVFFGRQCSLPVLIIECMGEDFFSFLEDFFQYYKSPRETVWESACSYLGFFGRQMLLQYY